MLLCARIFLGARTTLMRFIFFGYSLAMDPFPNLNLVPGAFGEFDSVFRSQFSFFPWNRFSRMKILRYTTQLYRILQYRNWSFAPPFFDFMLGFSSASCRKWHLSPYTQPFQTCNSDTREHARIYMTVF